MIGAGVNGSICTEGLVKAGIAVTVLARGKRCEEIRNQGIVIENPVNGRRTVTQVPVIDMLHSLNIKIVPAGMNLLKIIPRFVIVTFLKTFIVSKLGEVGAIWHISQAPDEMEQLTREYGILADKSRLPLARDSQNSSDFWGDPAQFV